MEALAQERLKVSQGIWGMYAGKISQNDVIEDEATVNNAGNDFVDWLVGQGFQVGTHLPEGEKDVVLYRFFLSEALSPYEALINSGLVSGGKLLVIENQNQLTMESLIRMNQRQIQDLLWKAGYNVLASRNDQGYDSYWCEKR